MFGVRLVLPRVHRRAAVPVVLSSAILLIVAADQGIEGQAIGRWRIAVHAREAIQAR
jgi:hypothetical protein